MTGRRAQLLKRGGLFCLLVILLLAAGWYGPQPSGLVEFFGEEWGELDHFYSSGARIGRFLVSLGPYASVAFILLQAVQVIISPIPGELTGLVGGFVFGTSFGFVLSTFGLGVGSWLAFELARMLGRPFAERLVGKRVLERFHFLTANTGAVICFVLFAFPGFPKDSLCYILGLSRMRLGIFLLVSTVGRIPGTYLLSVQGASLQERDYLFAVVLVLVCAGALWAAYACRRRLFRWLKRPEAQKMRAAARASTSET